MTVATATKPFAAKLAAAKQREAEAARQREEVAKLHEEQASATQESQPQPATDPVQELRRFGYGFLDAVDRKVVNPNWNSEYMELVVRYAEGLLRNASHVDDLPVINERHVNQILDKFEYGVHLAKERGVEFPEGYFVGQTLLSQREEEKKSRKANKVERISIVPGAKPRGPRPEGNTGRAVDDLPPAITPKPRNKRAGQRKKR